MSFFNNIFYSDIKKLDDIKKEIDNSKKKTEELKQVTKELSSTQKKLDIERNKFRLLFEKSPLIKAFLELDGTITKVNKTFCDHFGYEPEELIGKNILDFVFEEDYELAKSIPDRFLSGDLTPIRMFHKYKTKSGEAICLDINIYPVEDDNGNFVVGVGENITKKLEIKEELRRTREALKYANDSIVITDKQGIILYVNDAFMLNSGYHYNEIMGNNPRILKSGQHDKKFYKDMWKTITSGKTWTGNITNKAKNGKLFTEQTTITPVANGVIKYFIAIKAKI